MAWHFRGNISGTVDSLPKNLPMVIDAFTLVNKTGGAVTANVYMIQALPYSGATCVIPNNISIPVNTMYESERPIVMLAGERIRVQTSGSVDYDFYIENQTPKVANNPTLTGNNTSGV